MIVINCDNFLGFVGQFLTFIICIGEIPLLLFNFKMKYNINGLDIKRILIDVLACALLI